MTFGKKLQWQRKKKGMSQEALAAELDVSRQAISKWEQDGALPDAVNVIRLARLFGVSTDYLLLDEIEEEGALPPAPVQNDQAEPLPPAPPAKKYPTVLSVIALCFGGLGHFIIYVLSRIIEVPYLRKIKLQDGTMVYEGGSAITTRDYSAFVREYKLDMLCTLFTLLAIAGAAYLFWHNRKAILSKVFRFEI